MTEVTKTTALEIGERDAAPLVMNEAAFEEFVEQIKREVAGLNQDVSVEKNRDEIRSAAHKIARCKTTIDAVGKSQGDEARATLDTINASRRRMKTDLEALKDEVRAPLTEWEEAEKERKEGVEATFAGLHRTIDHPALVDENSGDVAHRLKIVRGLKLPEEIFRERIKAAEELKLNAISALETAHARMLKEEKDREELEQLRKESAEREEREREEATKKAAEEAERQRIADAEERARAREREAHERELREQKEKHEHERLEAEAKVQREREEAEAESRREAEAEEARGKDEARRSEVLGEIAAAIAGAADDVPIQTCAKIAKAITDDEIPHVSVRF